MKELLHMAAQEVVWITGIGAATPLGSNYAQIAGNLLAGKSAAQTIVDSVGEATLRTPGALVDDVPLPLGWQAADFAKLLRSQRFAISCATDALRDAGHYAGRSDLRVGIVLGLGAEWLQYWEGDFHRGGDLCFRPEETGVSAVDFVAQHLQLRGPTATVAAACASSNYALAQARSWVRQGLVDICLAGSCEFSMPIGRASFHNLRALSRRTDDVERASRPFDRDRDGFVMGEGSAIFVLEGARAARQRGAKAYAEVAGFGASSDAYHMIIPSSDPLPASRAMQMALADAALNPAEISYVNAHATSTPVGDRAEAKALQLVFGERTMSTPVSSTKSMTGHLLSAAAAVEAIACIAALEEQAVPPTINLENPDCELCHVANESQPRSVRTALSNSFGFGGSNTSLVLRKVA
jgi:3-oxoacyl-[acyl-carrier-protein] synthase II